MCQSILVFIETLYLDNERGDTTEVYSMSFCYVLKCNHRFTLVDL